MQSSGGAEEAAAAAVAEESKDRETSTDIPPYLCEVPPAWEIDMDADEEAARFMGGGGDMDEDTGTLPVSAKKAGRAEGRVVDSGNNEADARNVRRRVQGSATGEAADQTSREDSERAPAHQPHACKKRRMSASAAEESAGTREGKGDEAEGENRPQVTQPREDKRPGRS
jgi:hypothetical protein